MGCRCMSTPCRCEWYGLHSVRDRKVPFWRVVSNVGVVSEHDTEAAALEHAEAEARRTRADVFVLKSIARVGVKQPPVEIERF